MRERDQTWFAKSGTEGVFILDNAIVKLDRYTMVKLDIDWYLLIYDWYQKTSRKHIFLHKSPCKFYLQVLVC